VDQGNVLENAAIDASDEGEVYTEREREREQRLVC